LTQDDSWGEERRMRIGLRPLWLATVLTLGLSAPALAAPTCQDRQGATVRCGGPTAMPVGWTLPDSERVAQPGDQAPPERVAAAVALVVCLFALIALMPPFDGRRGVDWDAEEDD
jgi:hypothetical protein